jgi:hydrogenase maturation protease
MDDTAAVRNKVCFGSVAGAARDVLVLGLGNTLLGDDGVGVHVVRHLANAPDTPPGLRPLDGGTLGFRLLAALMDSDAVIVVDAARLGDPAGTICLLDQLTLADHVGRGGRMSAHEAGLVDLLTLARIAGWAPTHLALVGIEPQRIDWGPWLSPPVAQSFPDACRTVVRTALAWQAEP